MTQLKKKIDKMNKKLNFTDHKKNHIK